MINKELITNPECFLFKLRKYGICVGLLDIRNCEYVLCPKNYILDGSINRNNYFNQHRKICPIIGLDSYYLDTLKLKNPEIYFSNEAEGFDMIAYKYCGTNTNAVIECLKDEDKEWDWEEYKNE